MNEIIEYTDIDDRLDWAKNEVKRLNKQKRKDAGIKRAVYASHLPIKYKQYIAGANSRGLVFELSVDEFNTITSKTCIYCGTNSKIGIDRVDSSIGYTINNSQPCCTTCNLMKHKHSQEDFVLKIKRIYEFLFKK